MKSAAILFFVITTALAAVMSRSRHEPAASRLTTTREVIRLPHQIGANRELARDSRHRPACDLLSEEIVRAGCAHPVVLEELANTILSTDGLHYRERELAVIAARLVYTLTERRDAAIVEL